MADLADAHVDGQEASCDRDSALCAIVERFETAWNEAGGHLPEIEHFLPRGGDDLRPAALVELVLIDLEWRWRRGGTAWEASPCHATAANGHVLSSTRCRPPLLDDYLARYPELSATTQVSFMLVSQEYRVRHRWGDRPAHEELLARFPEERAAVRLELERIDAELAMLEAPGPASDAETTGRTDSGPYGRYRLDRVLGCGGIGRVWLAYDRQLKRQVALKEILPHRSQDTSLQERFLLEAEITGRLQHPGIVPIHDLAFRSDTGKAFYVMPCIRGQTFSDAIQAYHEQRGSGANRRLELARLLDALIAVCDTVGYAHSRGVIHRDLNGSNVILGEFGEVIVLDWGVAKDTRGIPRSDQDGAALGAGQAVGRDGPDPRAASQRTTQGRLLGTPTHMSPEQALGRHDLVGPRSDVFSLGAILHEVLTGRPPFSGATVEQLVRNVAACRFDPVRREGPPAPKGLEAVCKKAMAAAPADRYESAVGLADDLRHWGAGEPVSAWKEPRAVRLRRWIIRHPVRSSIAATALFLGALGALAGGALWKVGEVRRHEEVRRHTERINDLAYANAEKDARAVVQRKPIEWFSLGMEKLGEASRIESPLRSATTLRSLAAEYCAGVDLKERCQLTSINAACLAFRRDGKRLAVGEHHGIPLCQVLVFDVASQKLAASYSITALTLDMIQTGVSSLAYSPDGRWLAAGLRNGKVLAWDTEKQGGLTVPFDLGNHKERVVKVAFSPIGTTLASASEDHCVKLSVFEKSWVQAASFDVPDKIHDFVFSPDGTRLACLADRGLYSLETDRIKQEPPFAHGQIQPDRSYADSQRICYGPDGQTYAASDGRRAIFLNPGRRNERRRLIDPDLGTAHTEDIHRLEFSPDGSLLVSGSSDNTIKVWDVASSELILTRKALTQAIVYPSFSPVGGTLAVGTSSGVTLFDVLGLETMTTRAFEPDSVRAFSFAAGDDSTVERLITATGEHVPNSSEHEETIGLWGLDSVRPLHHTAISWRFDGMRQVYFLEALPRSSLVAYGGGDLAHFFDIDKFREVGSTPAKESAALGFSPDGRSLWGVIDDLQVVSWSMPDRSRKTKWGLDETIKLSGRIGLACLAAGARWVVAGSRAGLVYVLRTTDGQQERVLRASGPIRCIALSPDESMVVCGLIDGRLALFRPESDERAREFPAHRDTINAVAFDAGGRLLASASGDKTVGLWNVDGPLSLTELLRIPSRSGHPVLSVKFSHNGRILGTLVQNESAVRLWHLDRLRSQLGTLGLNWNSSRR
ncbi:MAG: WD40 repeat domain-containing serine/threonine-protein kinase [Isosphaerales bacterium]